MMLRTTLYIVLIELGLALVCSAQHQTSEERPVYYHNINLGSSQPGLIFEPKLNIQYYDSYGEKEALALKVYNTRRETVGEYSVHKDFGTNYYTIQIDNIFDSWAVDEMYSIELVNEANTINVLLLKKIAPPKMEAPQVNILVNPIRMKCEKSEPGTVEFYGQISGGKTPYTTNWYILDQNRINLIYQPRQDIITRPGNTPVVTVDATPEYVVVLNVVDACGNEVIRQVVVTCDSKDKKINTLFIEPWKQAQPTSPGSN
jgi:hypothetical protein